MPGLPHEDCLALLDFLKDAFAIRGYDEFRRRSIAALRRLVSSDIACFVEINPGEHHSIVIDPPEVSLPGVEEALASDTADDLPNINQPLGHRIIRISDYVDGRESHRREVYRRLRDRFGVEHQATLPLSVSGSHSVEIILHRQRDFTERDRLILDQVRPHLIQAYRNTILFEQFHDAMANGAQAVIMLDRADGITYATGQAVELLAAYFEESARLPPRLPSLVESWASRERRRRRESGDDSGPASPLLAGDDRRRLVMRFLRDRRAVDESLILLTEEIAVDPTDLIALGLSPREAEVLAWVARGKTDCEIARSLVVSPRTVQKHLEHVYQKLGVRTRTAAATYAHNWAKAASARQRLETA